MKNIKYRFNPPRDFNKTWYEEHNFFYNQAYDAYVSRFTVWRISDTESAYCETRINPETFDVEADIYVAPKTYYAPYYYMLWHKDERTEEFDIITGRIANVFDELGIVRGD